MRVGPEEYKRLAAPEIYDKYMYFFRKVPGPPLPPPSRPLA